MRKTEINQQDQIGIERSTLMIFIIYTVITMVTTFFGDWPNWLMFVLFSSSLICVVIHITRFRDYAFRAFFTSLVQQLGFMLWAMNAKSLTDIMPVFAATVVTLGLYGVTEVMYIPVVTFTFLVFYHGVVTQTVAFSNVKDVILVVVQYFSIYFIEYSMQFLVRKRLEGNERQHMIISNLKRAEQSKDDFLANVSHEIRTPINTICGMSEIVLRENLSDEVRADLFSIQTAGRNLLSIVSDVLDFSELQSGKLELVQETYNITSTLNDVINMSMARINEKHIELIVDCAADIPRSLVGDEQKLRRVIMNLVNNAIKFTEEGCVSIIISFRRTQYGINLCVKIKDTGIGMKAESIEKLFSTYNQVDAKRDRQEGGIGLGLAISRALIDTMGGFITVRSEFGKGSEFQFVIPQIVADEQPIAVVHDVEKLNVIIYIDMERFDHIEIRDEYSLCIRHMTEQLHVKSHLCQNMAEIKRRVEREIYSHVFIGLSEYEEGKQFFDQLAKVARVIIILDREEEYRVICPDIQLLYKPFFAMPVVTALNNEQLIQNTGENRYQHGRFIAPDARILVVDDNLMNIRVLEGLLRPYQIKVSMATSGMEALEKIENMDYDFVFMDHMMPEMDGIETMHRIRKKPGRYFHEVPIIALTANAIGGMREVFLAEGFQDFVAKPIEISVLERVLKRNIPLEKQVGVQDEEELPPSGKMPVPSKAQEQPKPMSGGTLQQAVEADKPADAGNPVLSDVGLPSSGSEDAERIQKAKELELEPDRFDIPTGIRYCGTMEDYIEIVQMHFKDAPENREKIQNYYEAQDWKNYTILVHALKSSMLSIGVAELSGMAKKLEHAGKTSDVGYIQSHHNEMMEEYARVVEVMEKSSIVNQAAVQEDVSGLEELGREQFEELATAFEDAAYSFDGEKMEAILQQLQRSCYEGHGLREPLEPVARKIEMMDYVSAADVVRKLMEKL